MVFKIIETISLVGSKFSWNINQIIGSEKYFSRLNVISTGYFHQFASMNKLWNLTLSLLQLYLIISSVKPQTLKWKNSDQLQKFSLQTQNKI